jgi:hypothetical protein
MEHLSNSEKFYVKAFEEVETKERGFYLLSVEPIKEISFDSVEWLYKKMKLIKKHSA